MKNTCVIRIRSERYRGRLARFHPKDNDSVAEVGCWPKKLMGQFGKRPVGIYSIRRVKKSTARSVDVVIVGNTSGSPFPACFEPYYGICKRFLRELGAKPPAKDRRKTLHLVVRKLKGLKRKKC